ncbi:uncharacterized protein LOC141648722 [Silene latifolia]|uniref:uncharacterized protein LOC141648722 n=1 Tax=Silene latifolia TaxID=37657 RepID=UPI003D76FF89
MVLSPRQNADSDMVVADIWRADGASWDTTKVRNLFLPFEQDRILNMRISTTKPEDKWGWDLEKDGEYTVRSAYNVLTMGREDDAGTSNRAQEKGCGWTGGLWDRLVIDVRVTDGYERVREWVEEVWRELEDGEIELFMMECWAIWEARNGWVFENKEVDVIRVANRVRSLLREMQEESDGGESNTQAEVGAERWEKPIEGVMKLNIDAGVKEGWGVGFGVVCRDSIGVVKWGVSERRREVMEP